MLFQYGDISVHSIKPVFPHYPIASLEYFTPDNETKKLTENQK